MEEDTFPQFKPLVTYKILEVMYYNKFKDENP
jgi:hypothetical protein